MSKFSKHDLVRVTDPESGFFDEIGQVTEPSGYGDAPVSLVYIHGSGRKILFGDSALTLADPDVHTVLDQMDAESRVVTVGADTNNSFTMRITDPEYPAFKDITEQEIDGDYVRGLAADPVNHPQHYGGDTTYETIKVIEAWGLGFSIGNCVKYLSRAGKKGPALEDLRKARFYLDREIAAAEAAQLPRH